MSDSLSSSTEEKKHQDVDAQPNVSTISSGLTGLTGTTGLLQEQMIDTFLDEEQVFCVICSEIIKRPTQLFMSSDEGITNVCQHVFCFGCISTLRNNNCPLCQKPFNVSVISKLFEDLIQKQKVTCKHPDCKTVLKIREIITHYKTTCPYEKMPCNYCWESVVRKDLPEHKLICGARPVQCEACNEYYPCCSKVDHIKMTCVETHIKCRHEGCNTHAKRGHMKQHEDECIYKPINCQFYCDYIGIKTDVDKHLASETCPNQLIPCPTCLAMTKRCLISKHMDITCPKVLIECMYCNKEELREEMLKHTEVCPAYYVRCSVCPKMILNRDKDKHNAEKKNLHAVLASSEYKNLGLTVGGFVNYIGEDKVMRKFAVMDLKVETVTIERVVFKFGEDPTKERFVVELETQLNKLSKYVSEQAFGYPEQKADAKIDTSDPTKVSIIVEPGLMLDVKDTEGHWEPAVVRETKKDSVFIHFTRWHDKWDEWINYKLKPERFAPYRSRQYPPTPLESSSGLDELQIAIEKSRQEAMLRSKVINGQIGPTGATVSHPALSLSSISAIPAPASSASKPII